MGGLRFDPEIVAALLTSTIRTEKKFVPHQREQEMEQKKTILEANIAHDRISAAIQDTFKNILACHLERISVCNGAPLYFEADIGTTPLLVYLSNGEWIKPNTAFFCLFSRRAT